MNVAVTGVVPSRARGVAKWIALQGATAVIVGVIAMSPAHQARADTRGGALPPSISAAGGDDSKPYRAIGARHLYETHGHRIFKGPLPPWLYAIAIIETEIDEDGRVVSAVVTREPASAKEVSPWILGLIQAASPFPKPGRAGPTRYQDIWLVDQSYKFQLDTLTEGQQ